MFSSFNVSICTTYSFTSRPGFSARRYQSRLPSMFLRPTVLLFAHLRRSTDYASHHPRLVTRRLRALTQNLYQQLPSPRSVIGFMVRVPYGYIVPWAQCPLTLHHYSSLFGPMKAFSELLCRRASKRPWLQQMAHMSPLGMAITYCFSCPRL